MNVRLITAAIAAAAAPRLLFVPSSLLAQNKMGTMNADSIIASWPDDTRKAAQKVVARYGQPDVASDTMLVWHNKGHWILARC